MSGRDPAFAASPSSLSSQSRPDGLQSGVSEYFAFNEWSEDAFHTIEVQACGKTQTIQFACGDYSGDYHGENPSGVALTLDEAEELACYVLDHITLIRALAPIEARRVET